MRVKRYVVDSMPDALQKIRSELGKDAVILNTKEIRFGGFLGLFGKKKIEVIAATDSQASGKSPAASEVKRETATILKQVVAAAANSAGRNEQVAVMEQDFPLVPDVLSAADLSREAIPFAEAEPKLPLAAAYTSTALKQYTGTMTAQVKAKEDFLVEEIRQMKEMVHRLASNQALAAGLPHPELARLEARLIEQELQTELVTQIIQSINDELQRENGEITSERVCALASNRLADLFPASAGKQIAPKTRVAHFVGPTGVGKTTTIAKLAAEQVIKHHRKVGFITSDTYRIAAVEQLRTYANILNIPLEVVFSLQDLNKAFTQLKDCDLIFMDTAGRNFRNEMYVSELNALLQTAASSETFLVLSMTTKYKDMKAITHNFMKFKLDKVLFTKLDETDSYGPIINLTHDFSLQLSYVANGQNVPDDITAADEGQIIKLILGDYGHE